VSSKKDAGSTSNSPEAPADRVQYEPVRPNTPAEINFLDADMQNCPYHAYQVLRDQAPVWQDPITGFYVISRFDDLRNILLNTTDFNNSARGGHGGARDSLDTDRAQRMQQLYRSKGWLPAPTLAGRDDPNHRQMRAMFNEAFRPKKIEGMDPFVEATAYRLIDDFIDAGRCDCCLKPTSWPALRFFRIRITVPCT
jgi:cytochrome P450